MRSGTIGRRRSRALPVLTAAVVVTALLAIGGRPEPDAGGPVVADGSSPAAATSPPSADPLSAPQRQDATPAGTGAPPASSPAAPPAASPAPAPDPLAEKAAKASAITDSVEWASFTLVDRLAGRGVGDRRQGEVTNTESTVKAWLAADLLHERSGRLSDWESQLMSRMIRSSDDDAAAVIWRMLGADRSIARMIEVCRMTDTRVYPDWWSLTQISSRDLARLGTCIVPGSGRYLSATAGAQLLALMRTVDESNAFGIQQAQPAGRGVRIAVKNGWTEHGGSGLWNVNCLALWGPDLRYVLAVTTRYPLAKGLAYGADVCRRVTTTLFP
jgi:hypothetical protein